MKAQVMEKELSKIVILALLFFSVGCSHKIVISGAYQGDFPVALTDYKTISMNKLKFTRYREGNDKKVIKCSYKLYQDTLQIDFSKFYNYKTGLYRVVRYTKDTMFVSMIGNHSIW